MDVLFQTYLYLTLNYFTRISQETCEQFLHLMKFHEESNNLGPKVKVDSYYFKKRFVGTNLPYYVHGPGRKIFDIYYLQSLK